MLDLLLILVVALLLAALLFFAYVRWFVRRAVQENPRVQVELAADSPPGETRATLILRASARTFRVVRLVCDPEVVERLGIEPPEGFSTGSEDVETEVEWVPKAPLLLRPGQRVTVRVPIARPGEGPAVVRGDAEAGLGLGGTGVRFTITVAENRPAELERLNLRSDLMARACELGVRPVELPEWGRLQELESSSGPGGARGA